MALSPATIRQRQATAVDAVSGWTISRWAGAGVDHETNERMHKCASIEVVASEPVGGGPPQYRSEGAWTATTTAIHWRYRLRGDAHVADYDLGLAEELKLIAAVEAATLRNQCEITWIRSERTITESGEWLAGTITLRALHVLALQ